MFKLVFGLFLSHLYIQPGAQTHHSPDKGRLLHLLSHPGTLGVRLIFFKNYLFIFRKTVFIIFSPHPVLHAIRALYNTHHLVPQPPTPPVKFLIRNPEMIYPAFPLAYKFFF